MRLTGDPVRQPDAAGTIQTRPAGVRRHLPRLVLAGLVVSYGMCVLRTAWLSDDAYITFRTVDNFVAGYGPRWNVAERVQAFTHPLWMLLVSALYFATGEIYFTVVFTSILLSLAAFSLLGWRALRLGVHPLMVAGSLGALIVSRAFVDYSTSGLENALSHLLLVAFVIVFLDERRGSRRLFFLALLASLGGLNRTDTLLLYAPALVLELWQSRSWKSFRQVVQGFLPLLLWESFSIIYYGFPFPNSAYAKLSTGIPVLSSWACGLAYFINSLRWDPVTLVAIAMGLAIGLVQGSGRGRALATGVLLYLLYIVHIGGDFMSGRFFAAPLLVIVATVLLARRSRLQRGWTLRALPVTVLLVGLLGTMPTLLSGFGFEAGEGPLIDEFGTADERAFYFSTTGLLGAGPEDEAMASATVEEPRRAAVRHDPLVVQGAVGVFGYHVGPGTYVLDYYALGDPLLSRLPTVTADPLFRDFCVSFRGSPCEREWRSGHFLRNIPDGYVDSILADGNLIVDADLREFYAKLRLITRGPLWSAERWSAIVRMNLGLYDHLLGPRVQVPYRATSFTETLERLPEVPSLAVLRGAARQYRERGQMAEAIACYDKAVALDDADATVWSDLGAFSLQLGQVDQAIAHYTRALSFRPNLVVAHFYRGVALERARRLNEAAAEYEQAIRLQPKHVSAHNNLGVILSDRGEFQAAIEHLRQVVELKPDYADGQFNLGATLLQAGQPQEAIPHLRESLRLKPDDAVAAEKLRLALAGDRQTAPR